MRASPLRVLVVGALSRTGQHLARTLAARDDFCVTALCGRAMGELIADDNGSILDAGLGIRFLDGGSVVADAVVIATDDPPPKESLEYLLQCCSRQGVSQTVLLSRIGASKDGFGLRRWKDAEGCASALPTEAGLTIVRCAQPLIGGPYYALDPDLLAKSNAAVADQWKAAEVAAGDGSLAQGGFGCSRATAANAIAGVLRRGPSGGGADSYCVTSLDSSDGAREAWTDAAWDAAFGRAGGAAGGETPATAGEASLSLDVTDERLAAFTQPRQADAPNPLVAPLAASGPYYGTALLFLYGAYLTTTPEYIANTGINYWQGILN